MGRKDIQVMDINRSNRIRGRLARSQIMEDAYSVQVRVGAIRRPRE